MEKNDLTSDETTTAALAHFLEDHLEPRLVNLEGPDGRKAKVLVVAGGLKAQSIKPLLDEYLTAPERRKGTARLHDLVSFIGHTSRFADEHSVIFADPNPKAPSLAAVLDYHQKGHEGAPRFGEHRALYNFPLSEEWLAWTSRHGVRMSQVDFAAFLEDRINDVASPPEEHELIKHGGFLASPSRLVELARGLEVNVGAAVKNAMNLSSGEAQIQFVTEHRDAQGKPLSIPTAFVIGIPVFKNGAPYEVGVRLRYRVKEGSVSWFIELHRADKVFDHAFREACDTAAQSTGLPLYLGSPEA